MLCCLTYQNILTRSVCRCELTILLYKSIIVTWRQQSHIEWIVWRCFHHDNTMIKTTMADDLRAIRVIWIPRVKPSKQNRLGTVCRERYGCCYGRWTHPRCERLTSSRCIGSSLERWWRTFDLCTVWGSTDRRLGHSEQEPESRHI